MCDEVVAVLLLVVAGYVVSECCDWLSVVPCSCVLTEKENYQSVLKILDKSFEQPS